jgi:hypothetical protein
MRGWVQALNSDKAAEGYRAVWELARAGDGATAWLAKQLPTFKPVPPARLRRLLARLGSDDYEEREEASAELEKLGFAAEDALRKLVSRKADPEARRRARELLARLERAAGEQHWLLFGRALEALEQAGTPAARNALRVLAGRGAGLRLRREARAACRRLERLDGKRP